MGGEIPFEYRNSKLKLSPDKPLPPFFKHMKTEQEKYRERLKVLREKAEGIQHRLKYVDGVTFKEARLLRKEHRDIMVEVFKLERLMKVRHG
jgi:hypothetical protein